MKMRLLLTLICVTCLSADVFAEGENDIKRGVYPYMAFLYYSDESVVDMSGNRFLRGAVLIRTDWLITSAIQISTGNDAIVGFPRKTLLARLGAITINDKFTLNEDEDEQEREIILVVRPYNHSATQWWRTDVTLMKTLLPFNISSAVSPAIIHTSSELSKSCSILVFAKRYGNLTEDRVLMQLSVELLPPSIQNCGTHYSKGTMICAADSDENKNAIYDPNFCQGNSGGPLICDSEIKGLQTYIDNNCRQPHLYQLLTAWDNFISCGIDERCDSEQCSHTCFITNKDPPPPTKAPWTTETTAHVFSETDDLLKEITNASAMTSDSVSELNEVPTHTIEVTKAKEKDTTDVTTTTTITTVSEDTTTTNEETTQYESKEESETKSWPKEKDPKSRRLEEDTEDIERPTNVEAQQHDVKKKNVRSAATNNMCIFQSFSVLVSVLVSFI